MRDGVGLFGDCGFIVMDGFMEGFVVGVEGDDGEEGDEEGKVGGDVLLVEDDVEVVGVLGEEYFFFILVLCFDERDMRKRIYVYVVYVLVIIVVIIVVYVS